MTEEIRDLEIRRVYPNRRIVVEQEQIESFCRTIRTRGQLEPIKVWFDGKRFRILDGEKRWRACCRLGLSRIRAVIVTQGG